MPAPWDHLSKKEGTAIQKALDKYKIAVWGFVVFRCTYGSQEKWDKFVRLMKQDAFDYFELRGIEPIYDHLVWTILEDETLDGADILETSQRFEKWVKGPGKQEMQGSAFHDGWTYYPRYTFFLHVDEESLESVTDDAKAREPNGYFCKVVRSDMVLSNERHRQDSEYTEEVMNLAVDSDDDEAIRDFRKRLKLDDLIGWFAALLDIDSWYNIYIDQQKVAWAVMGVGQEWR